MNCICILRNGSPVYIELTLLITGVMSESILHHIVNDCLQVTDAESPVDLRVHASCRVEELSHTHFIALGSLAEMENHVSPLLELTLARVRVLLDCVEERPVVTGWELY